MEQLRWLPFLYAAIGLFYTILIRFASLTQLAYVSVNIIFLALSKFQTDKNRA